MSFEKITIPAPAKINIFLEVTSRRPDGYHNISTVFCLTALSDEIVIEKIQRGNGRVDFHCDIKELDTQENLVVKAAEKILNYTTDKTCGLKITLRKKIPWGAGLGGGSSDAASTLKGVRNLLRVKISDEELLKIGTSLGADVPFFIKSYLCARADGIGEKIKQLPPFWLQEEEPLTLLIVKPPFEIPTKEAYSRIRFPLTAPREIDRITKAIKSGKKFSKSIAPLVFNRFEEVLDRKSATVISRIKKVLIANGAAAALMSGSGSAVVGFFTKNSRVSTLKVAAFFKKSPGLSEKIFITNFAS